VAKPGAQASEDDDGPESALKRMSQFSGVSGYVIFDSMSAIPVKFSANFSSSQALQVAAVFFPLVVNCKDFLQKKNFHTASTEVNAIRLRTWKNEIVIAPEENFTLVVFHENTTSGKGPRPDIMDKEKEEKQFAGADEDKTVQ